MEEKPGLQLPLMANQKRLWIISQQDNSNPSYNIQLSYHFEGKVDAGILQRSLQILFDRQHTMFSLFRQNEGTPYITIVPRIVEIGLKDFTGIPISSRRDEIISFIGDDSRLPFDIENGPLYRIHLIKEAEESWFFYIAVHHLIFDGFSRKLFVHELSDIYGNLLKGIDARPNPLKFHSYDFADHEKIPLSKEKEKELVKFWKKNLEDCQPVLKFPFDYPRKIYNSGFGSKVLFVIPEDISDKLRKISKDEDSSLFKTLLSLIGAILQKYTGENDICIGFPVSNRRTSDSFRTFGIFVKTVVARLLIDGEKGFGENIKHTNKVVTDATNHSALPFEKIVEEINPERIAGVNPFFQVSFSWINNFTIPLDFAGIIGNRFTVEKGSSPFEISFYMWEQDNCIHGEVEYSTDLLKKETINRFTKSFLSLIKSVANNPFQPLSEISVLSDTDKRKIIEFNDTDTPYERNLCIHEKLELQARENPELPALLFNNQSLSYKELDDNANMLANYLIKRGVLVEDKVGVCLDRSLEMMVGIFGILKAGAAYLPLNPENPRDRLKSITDDARPKLVLSSRISSANIPDGNEVVFIDDILHQPLSDLRAKPDVKVSPTNLAYVLYTSGSTGVPKGVMIEHHSVLNRLNWMQKAYPVNTNDTLLQKTPITFDVSVWELFWWSFAGARLVLLPKGGERDPETLIEWIDKYRVTTIHFVPSMFASFFETITTINMVRKLEHLNRIFLSGEALPLKLVKEFNDLRGSFSLPDLINLYGPTEATVDVSYFNCPEKVIKNVYIGKPIDNTKLFVVNSKNMLQPIGVPGELLITGVNLARGYLNRPELTNEKFFTLKISDELTVRAYHSGDLVKLVENGEIDYLGRIDNQVKIRGFRIELGEIEAKILEHPAVTHCAVIVVDKGEFKYLVGYVCLKPGNELESDKLRNFISGKLPDYMVPSFIVFLDELPLTSSGKLNRKSLPQPDMAVVKNTIIAPTTEYEKKLVDLWRALLKIEHISIGDNFFDVGGNSILAINLANQVSKEFSQPVKALMIFEYPTIKDQSEFLSGKRGDQSASKNIEIHEQAQRKKNVNFRRTRN